MLIEEIIRSCANERVAEAAVASIGQSFSAKVRESAFTYGISVGAFTALSVERFARHGDEGELRSVLVAMDKSQEPLLAGLHRILCIMLASGMPRGTERDRLRMPSLAAQVCAMEAEARRSAYF